MINAEKASPAKCVAGLGAVKFLQYLHVIIATPSQFDEGPDEL